MRFVILALALAATGCGAILENAHGYPVFAPAPVDKLEFELENAAAFWSEHGVTFNIGMPGASAVQVIETDDLDDPKWAAQCGGHRGEIRIRPRYVEGDPAEASCMLAHELGHSLGMDHVLEPHSLMDAKVFVPPGGGCFWSDDDVYALAHPTRTPGCP